MDEQERTRVGARLLEDAQGLGLSLDRRQTDALVEYLAQLSRWNRTYNLTAIREVEAMRVQHILDCLAIVPLLRQLLPAQATLLDVGSGGGLPGVVLAVMEPGWVVTCVDAVEKKMAFVRQVSGVLRLPNLKAQHARVETLAIEPVDVVISRAFASLDDFAALAGRHVREDGTLAAMKGREPGDEITALLAHGEWRVAAIHPLLVPGLDAQRCLLLMERTHAGA
ncbi:16S rRNA (guanine(527)-N(7))-methyltransferase RsmG [Verticiella sediminum]|uniref:Ribosomal RNA small subunit methyltransferase G n=1 Tax=Verticiella sediminum TaxID=1247510 RepID=A0A556B036_9BURK|nr:16S rRNA (guanine(527)-N(7))-methyltransferase RsmG [Verticiella sediminum]TSH98539.1 16S rRNA (guanine(527)-N(7))-methyltransferase RsmG [Verticiella sediminum]